MMGRKLAEDARQVKALELAAEGKTYSEIAAALGYSDKSGARKLVQRALAARADPSAAQLRVIEGVRLDMLLRAVWPHAMKGETESVREAVRISERRAKLFGLDAPAVHKVDMQQRDERVARIKALAAQLVDDLEQSAVTSPVTNVTELTAPDPYDNEYPDGSDAA
ncbi:hypothetical protein [Streptomyces sp. NPDC052701]|uniref:hypothetical protein n=1 Tax=Streptomyces sp. NPDC052701 TaxID=3155533 RepID=UPI003424616D